MATPTHSTLLSETRKTLSRWTLIFLSLLMLGNISLAAGEDWAQAVERYDTMLKAHVKNGMVNYQALVKEQQSLKQILSAAEHTSKQDYENWSEMDQLAFMMNVYNARTLLLIVENYPVESIKDLGSWYRSPWAKSIQKLFGEMRSLDELEHELIRPVFKQPLVHFALVCAAKGCPPLRAEAYTGSRLLEQLQDQANVFLTQSPGKNSLDSQKQQLHLSPIFKWYGDDFAADQTGLKNWLEPWITGAREAEIDWTYYDWSLNEQ